jgi:hypothetical protein
VGEGPEEATVGSAWTATAISGVWSGASSQAVLTGTADVTGEIAAGDTIIIDPSGVAESKIVQSVTTGPDEITVTVNLSNTHTSAAANLTHPSGVGDAFGLFSGVTLGLAWDESADEWALAAGATAPVGSDATWPTISDYKDLRLGNLYVEDDIFMSGSAINFNETTTPTATNNTGWVYTKDASGITELHYTDDLANGGNEVQITLDGGLNRDAVLLATIGTPTYTNVQDLQDTYHSAGWISGGAITADGTNIDVAAGAGAVRIAATRTSELDFFNWASNTGNATSTLNTYWVSVDYNSGSPLVVITNQDSEPAWDYYTEFPLGVVYNEGGTLHILENPHAVGDHANFMIQRMYQTQQYARDDQLGGLAVGEDTTTGAITGTATAGAASTITLAVGASAVDGFYNGWSIEITGGTSSGDFRTITDYVGSTRVATVAEAWTTPTDNTSTYDANPRYGTMSAGAVWSKLNRAAIGAIDTGSGDVFDAYYTTDGGTTWSSQTGLSHFPNYQYNNTASGLVTMTDGYFMSLWLYLDVSSTVDAGWVMYGQAEFSTLADVTDNDVEPGNKPQNVELMGLLVGRVIFQKYGAAASEILSAFTTGTGGAGGGGGISNHGDLSGLMDDDHTQYLLVAGSRAMSGNLAMGSNDITGVDDIGTTATGSGNLYVGADKGTRYEESSTDPTNAASTGWVYTKQNAVSGTETELWYEDASGQLVQITNNGELNIAELSFSLDEAYNDGHTIAVDDGSITLNVTYDATPSEGSGFTGMDIDIAAPVSLQTWTHLDLTVTAGTYDAGGQGLVVNFTNLALGSTDTYLGVSLLGPETITGTSNAISIDANWDAGIVNSASLDQDGTADFSNGLVMSAGELELQAGSNLQLNDSVVLSFGTGDDYTLTSDGTDLTVDMVSATGKFLFQLGTADDQATSFVIEDSGGADLWKVFADGSVVSAGGSPIPVGGGNKAWDITASSVTPSTSTVTGLYMGFDNSAGTEQDGTNSGALLAANFHVVTNASDTAAGDGYDAILVSQAGTGTALTGTVTTTAASATVTGSGSNFSGEVTFGDLVKIGGETKRIINVASTTVMTAESVWVANTGVAASVIEPSQVNGLRVGPDFSDGTVLHDHKWNGVKLDNNTSLSFGTADKALLDSGGTVSVAGSLGSPSTTVTGAGTTFSSDLAIGDVIEINGLRRKVASITSATVLDVEGTGFSSTAAGITAYKVAKSIDLAWSEDAVPALASGIAALSVQGSGASILQTNQPILMWDFEFGPPSVSPMSLPIAGQIDTGIALEYKASDSSTPLTGVLSTFNNENGVGITSGENAGYKARYNAHSSDTADYIGFQAEFGGDDSGTVNQSVSMTGFQSSRQYTTALEANGEINLVYGKLVVGGMNTQPTGTVSVTAGSTTVTGSGTFFLDSDGSQTWNPPVLIGDTIMVGDQMRVVTAVASNTSLTVSTAFGTSMSAQIWYTGSPGVDFNTAGTSGVLNSMLAINRTTTDNTALTGVVSYRYQAESDATSNAPSGPTADTAYLSDDLGTQAGLAEDELTIDSVGSVYLDDLFNGMWIRDLGGPGSLTVGTSVSVSGTAVTGIGTTFLSEIAVGDFISFDDVTSTDIREVTVVASDLSITVASAFDGTYSGSTLAYRRGPHFGSIRRVSDYNGTSGVATMYSAWPKVAGGGTVTVGAGSDAVTGTGTIFLSQLEAGDLITIAGEQIEVLVVGSDTGLTLASTHTAGATGAAWTIDRPSATSSFGAYGRNVHGLVFDDGPDYWRLTSSAEMPNGFFQPLEYLPLQFGGGVAEGSLFYAEQATDPTDPSGDLTSSDGGFVYTKDVSGTPQLFYKGVGTAAVPLTGTGSAGTLDEAYDGPSGSGSGRQVTVDSGAVQFLHQDGTDDGIQVIPDTSVNASSDSAFYAALTGGLALTQPYKAFRADMTGSTVSMDGQDYHAVELTGVTNSGLADSVGFYANGFDYALNAPDSTPISVGANHELQIYYDSTDAYIENIAAAGDFYLLQSNTGGATVVKFGTSTAANEFQVQDSGSNVLFEVDASGAGFFDADITFLDDEVLSFGTNTDWSIVYDETTDDRLEFTGAASADTVAGTDFLLSGSAGGAGNGGAAGAGGAITLTSGTGGGVVDSAAAAGGDLTLTAGLGGISGTGVADGGDGGTASIAGGQGGAGSGSQVAGAGGALTITGGGAGSPAGGTGAAGGDITITGGGGTGSADGGDITINGGNSTSGTDGIVTVGSSNTSAVAIGNVSADTTVTALDIHLDANADIHLDAAGEVISNSGLLAVASSSGNTAQAGAPTTITLNAADNQVDDYYNGWTVSITGGTGSGQTKKITAYVSSTDVATVATTWATDPDNTSVYTVTNSPVAGDLVVIDANGTLQRADNTTAYGHENVAGIAANTADGVEVELASLSGTIGVVSSSLSGETNGAVVYLSGQGTVTTTAPVSSGTTVYRIGIIADKATNRVLYQPQFIANNP